jgi:hypothetical protein
MTNYSFAKQNAIPSKLLLTQILISGKNLTTTQSLPIQQSSIETTTKNSIQTKAKARFS